MSFKNPNKLKKKKPFVRDIVLTPENATEVATVKKPFKKPYKKPYRKPPIRK